MKELFLSETGLGYSKENLLEILSRKFSIEEYKTYSYEDLFFLVFLNFIEPNFKNEFIFIYDYPKELSALAKVEGEIARRFEFYFGRVELGNAFYELNDKTEQKNIE
jgi:elongation factor P--(R)-beta-lysine ligase